METKKFFMQGDVWACAGGATARIVTVDPATGSAQVRQTSGANGDWTVDVYGRKVFAKGEPGSYEACPANLTRLLSRADGLPVRNTAFLDFKVGDQWVRRDEMTVLVQLVQESGAALVVPAHGVAYAVGSNGRVSNHMQNAGDLMFRAPLDEQHRTTELAAAAPTKDSNPKEAIGDKKVPMWLCSAIAKAHWAAAQFAGLMKYGAWNWRVAGVRTSTYISAMLRHIDRYANGERLDPVDGTHHLGNIMACAAILLEAEYLKKLNDDRSPRADLGDAFTEVEAIMARLKVQYADKNPHHHTILDEAAL